MAYVALLRSKRLRELCNAHGYNVARLARDIGFDRSSVYRVLRGETLPSSSFMAGCAVIFGQDVIPEVFEFAHEDELTRETDGDTFAPVMRRRESAPINTGSPLADAARGRVA